MMSALHVGGNGWCVGGLWPGWVFRPEYSVLAVKWIPMSGPVSQVDSESQLCPHASPSPTQNAKYYFKASLLYIFSEVFQFLSG